MRCHTGPACTAFGTAPVSAARKAKHAVQTPRREQEKRARERETRRLATNDKQSVSLSVSFSLAASLCSFLCCPFSRAAAGRVQHNARLLWLLPVPLWASVPAVALCPRVARWAKHTAVFRNRRRTAQQRHSRKGGSMAHSVGFQTRECGLRSEARDSVDRERGSEIWGFHYLWKLASFAYAYWL